MQTSGSCGPVTQAIRNMRAAEPVKSDTVSCLPARTDTVSVFAKSGEKFTQGIRALSRTEIEDLIGGLIDLFDAMDGDPDLEDSHDAESNTDDNGIADYDAIGEQGFRGYGGCL